MAFFSIITPTLNRRTLLERVWYRLKEQSYSDWEWCVVNDGSTDATAQWLESLRDERVKVAHFSQCQGVAAARNHGLSMATAPWLTFIDDDDDWEPHHLQTLFELMEENGFNEAIYKTGLVLRYKNKNTKLPHLPTVGNYKFENILKQEFGVSYAVPTKIALRIKFEEDMSRGSDEYFLWRLLNNLELHASEKYTVYYNMTDNSLSRNGIHKMKDLESWVYCMSKLSNLLSTFSYFSKNPKKVIVYKRKIQFSIAEKWVRGNGICGLPFAWNKILEGSLKLNVLIFVFKLAFKQLYYKVKR